MIYPPMPDAELVVCAWLRDGGAKVSTMVPANNTVWPWITVQRIGGMVTDATRLVDQPRIHLQAWGATQQQARDAMASALARVFDLPGKTTLAEVTDVAPDQGMAFMPDDSQTPPRPRYVAGVQLTMRPGA